MKFRANCMFWRLARSNYREFVRREIWLGAR